MPQKRLFAVEVHSLCGILEILTMNLQYLTVSPFGNYLPFEALRFLYEVEHHHFSGEHTKGHLINYYSASSFHSEQLDSWHHVFTRSKLLWFDGNTSF